MNSNRSIDGQHLALRILEQNHSMGDLDFFPTAYWIQVHNFPMTYFSKEYAYKIGDRIGRFIKADLAGDGKLSCVNT